MRFTTGGRAAASSLYELAKGSVPAAQAPQARNLTPSQIATMEAVRQLVNTQVAALTGAGIPADDIVVSWTLTTQSIGVVAGATRTSVLADPAPTPALSFAGPIPPASGQDESAGRIYAGVLSGVPYFLEVAEAPNDPTPLQTFWRAAAPSPLDPDDEDFNLTAINPLPEVRTPLDLPLLATVPDGPPPTGAGWPVVIFQHGITRNRTDLLAVADTLARAGLAAVAIDLPLHGLTGNEDPPVVGFFDPANERTFDLDLVDNATGAPGPDGVTDASGTHFFNLASLLTARDNLRQGVVDLFGLLEAIPDMQLGLAPTDVLDPNRVYFLGDSLGAMIGGVFLALDAARDAAASGVPRVRDAVLATPGGGIAKLLDGSAAFGPLIADGLAAEGVIKGTFDYERFLLAAQTVVDSGDPLNHSAGTPQGRGVLLYEVVGGAGAPPDQTIPNNVVEPFPEGTEVADDSPTAGTDPLAEALGLTQVSGTTGGSDLDAIIRFTAGAHGSILDPGPSAAVTAVMQEAAAVFLASDGAQVTISVPEVVE